MLGCHDFCGHYDWTFAYLGRTLGRESVNHLWAQAIKHAQHHYAQAGHAQGLQGLYNTWTATGKDEQCDWTFQVDEEKNILRWDMRSCPSKGYLIDNDLNADEDYCDHCMGWIIPALDEIGAEIVGHEHNHFGQCWAEIRMRDRPSDSSGLDANEITADPRWSQGYIDRWKNNVKLPLLKHASSDSVTCIRDWFDREQRLAVIGRGPSAADGWIDQQPPGSALVIDPTYSRPDVFTGEPRGVLIGDRSCDLKGIARRFNATAPEKRPLLMHAFLPGAPALPFANFDLPRPIPILPLLIRTGLYLHKPNEPYPTTGVFALLIAAALKKPTTVVGIDLYKHPSGMHYVKPADNYCLAKSIDGPWPVNHSESCDVHYIRLAMSHLKENGVYHPSLHACL
ncbi:hypothetical protein [Poriferisphaera sp. WC338]|uniref:hypothetical protein n=1 Tax=Poriferisphaera sp. WC338 TaxID=3425129 RepID=UPI003D819D6B